MTQALINSTDILHSNGFAVDMQTRTDVAMPSSDDTGIDSSIISDFDTILDKTMQDTCSDSQIVPVENGDMTIETPDLSEILVQAIQEVKMEKSLDLTLSKEIAATISSIKISSNPEIEQDIEEDIPVEDIIFVEEDDEEEENNISQKNTEIKKEKPLYTEETPVVFEQVLTVVNNHELLNKVEENNIETSDFNTESNTSELQLSYKPNEVEDKADLERTSDNLINEDMLEELDIEFVGSDNNAFDNSASGKESPEEFGVKVMLNHSIEKQEAEFTKTLNNEVLKPANITPEKIIEQITKQMDSLKNNSGVKIVLNPEYLGKVNLQILNTKDGLSAQFTVTTNDARELLMKGLDGLKESLLAQGVGVDNISVKISEPEKTSYNPDWTEQENSENSSKGQQKQNREEKEKGLFEKTIAENLKKENGNV